MLILMMVGILIAAGCVMETTPNIVILAPILKPLADNDRHERDPVLHHDDHRAGRRVSSRRRWASTCSWFRGSRANRSSRSPTAPCPFVFFMLIVTLLIAYVPAISTSLLARHLQVGRAHPCP
jgi:C4-dicarboxylate transporter DctM subunit